MRVNDSATGGGFDVTATGGGMTGRAGTGLLAETADTLGLTAALRAAADGCRSWSQHPPGKVIRDLVLVLADGGDTLRHLGALGGEDQRVLFGDVASAATACRTVAALADDELAVTRLAAARRSMRVRSWEVGGAPPVVAAARRGETPAEPLAIDLDATLITAHCDDKDGAAPTYKRGFGFHPLLAYLDRGDGLGESLGGQLRSGNASANTAVDHIDVFETAFAALPDLPEGVRLLVRADNAGCTSVFLDYLRQAGVAFSVGFKVTVPVRDAIRALADDAWQAATRQDGTLRDGAAVAELTDTLKLGGWPSGSRVIVRREPLHPGAQQTLDDIDGARFTCFLTDQTDTDLAVLDTRHRAHARVEDRIRGAKDTGARNLPCDTFDRNAVWLELVLTAQDLMVHMQALTLDGKLRVAEPATLRYQLLHAPARLVRHARRWRLDIQHDWPWAEALIAAFRRLRSLPAPAT